VAQNAILLFLPVSVFLHDISKTDAVRIIKLDVVMFHDESWGDPFIFGVKVTSHKNIACVGICTLVSVGFL